MRYWNFASLIWEFKNFSGTYSTHIFAYHILKTYINYSHFFEQQICSSLSAYIVLIHLVQLSKPAAKSN